ncbi:MAG TPA: aldo/keto reductase [Acidimicrobiales bacterium]|nr:aldo/keto reductase [Acidimicrobiales bacterium]
MKFVQAAGAKVSAIGVGTWQFGAREWGYGEDYATKTAGDIVRRALELGINLFDTAEVYGLGRSERILGETLEKHDWRDRAFLATKFWPVLPTAAVVTQRARASAARLRTDRIDLYQVHWPNPMFPTRMVLTAMRDAHDSGLLEHVGVSNYDLTRWKAAESAFGGPVLSNQVSFSLANRKPLQRLVPWAQENDRIVIAYSPLAQGLLGGRYDEQNRPSDLRSASRLFLPESLRAARPLIDSLREIARAHDARPAQVALAWLISHPNVVAIPGASSVEQLESNAAAADLALTESDRARLIETAEAFVPPTPLAAAPGILRSLVDRVRGG